MTSVGSNHRFKDYEQTILDSDIDSSESEEDLQALVEFLVHHNEIAKRIAQAGHDFILQFLKMSDIEEYWIQLISKYAAKLTFQPKTHDAMIPVKQTKRH